MVDDFDLAAPGTRSHLLKSNPHETPHAAGRPRTGEAASPPACGALPAGEGPLLAWPLACGHAVASRTRTLDFANGILRVEVPDAGWRAELQALAPQYLAVINRFVSEDVDRIEFVVVGRISRTNAPPSS